MPTERSDVDELIGEWQDNRDALNALFEQLHDACDPANEVDRGLLEFAFTDLMQARRARHFVELIEEALIVDTKNYWCDWQENAVKRLTAKLASEPAATLAELKRLVLGYHWLIDCWLQIGSLMERESASPDADRDNSIGRKADDSSRPRLSRSETERLTRVYGLLADGEPTEREILAFYADTSLLPAGAKVPCATPLPPRSQCRQRVRAVIERELPPL